MPSSPTQVLIVGAGMAGLTAANQLHQQGVSLTVVDKGRGVGGRMATRRQGELRWDHGAQYLTAKALGFAAFVETLAEQGIVKPWLEELHHLDGFKGSMDAGNYGKTTWGSPRISPTTRWVGGKGGIRTVCDAMASTLPASTLHLSTRITRLEPTAQGWAVWGETVTPEGATPLTQPWLAEAVVLTCPLPQALALLAISQLTLEEAQHTQLASVQYAACWTMLASLTPPLEKLRYYKGIKAFNPKATLGWVADNTTKAGWGKGPHPANLITLQAGPDWSDAHLEADKAWVAEQLWQALGQWAGDPLPNPEHTMVHLWRYAFARNPLIAPCMRLAGLPPLVLAGDAFGGEGKVQTAFASGHAAAAELISCLGVSLV